MQMLRAKQPIFTRVTRPGDRYIKANVGRPINWLYASEQIGSSDWEVVPGGGVTPNVANPPIGYQGQQADRILDVSSVDSGGVRQWVSGGLVVPGREYVVSAFIRKEDQLTSAGLLAFSNTRYTHLAMYDLTLTSGSGHRHHDEVAFPLGVTGVGVLDAGDYWRVWFGILVDSASVGVEIRAAIGALGGAEVDGTQTGGITAWGMQFEPGRVPRAYVPRGPSAVTAGQLPALPDAPSFPEWPLGEEAL
jgi:hypothetical protein